MKIMEMNNLKADDVNWVIPHEANLRIIEAVTKRGNAGKTKIDFTQEVGFQTLANKMEVQNSYNMAMTRNQVRYPMNYAYSAGNSPFCGGCGCNIFCYLISSLLPNGIFFVFILCKTRTKFYIFIT